MGDEGGVQRAWVRGGKGEGRLEVATLRRVCSPLDFEQDFLA